MFRKSETARTQLSGKNIILNDRPSPRPNIMQVVNESMYLKKVFLGRWASASASFHSRSRPHTSARGRGR